MKKLTSQNRLLTMNSSSKMDKSSWIFHVRNLFEESELEEEFDTNQIKVCIYNVPNSLQALKPEAYTPHIIAIGPYHHLRQDLYEMERYKLICAKKVQKELKLLDFDVLVRTLMKKEGKIRGCYHKYLDMDSETLAWRMAIDGLFLVEFLHAYANKNNSSASSARMSFLVNSMGKKMAYDSIVSDVYMLENQIPLFVLREVLRMQCCSSDEADKLLYSMLLDVCKEHSPLVLNQNYPMSEAIGRAHLLDLLYHLIVPKLDEIEGNTIQQGLISEIRTSLYYLIVQMISSATSKVINGVKRFKRNVFSLEPCRPVLSLLPCCSEMSATTASASTYQGTKHQEGSTSENGNASNDSEVPLIEEIMIPSVFELTNAGIILTPTEGDISSIQFYKKTLCLPVVRTDGNTDAIMRNLIAYEASAISGPLVLARFAELMNGIIDEPRDSEILRRKKIIISRLRSDKEVTDLWQGMTKAIRLTKVEFIDEAIDRVNKCYKVSPKVVFRKVMKTYVFASWRFLIVFVTMWFSGLMSLQSFCSVYDCPYHFDKARAPSSAPSKLSSSSSSSFSVKPLEYYSPGLVLLLVLVLFLQI